jgi:hypothetical protein
VGNPKYIDDALTAFRVYLGSVDRTTVKQQARLYSVAMKHATKIAKMKDMDVSEVWEQLMTEAQRLGRVLALPGKHI